MASSSLFVPAILMPSRPIPTHNPLHLRLKRISVPNSPFSSISTSSFRPCWPWRGRRVFSAVSDDSNEFSEARGAVVELLREAGVGEENAKVIALNSPNYLQMVIENVRELDELGLWGSWSSESGEGDMGNSNLGRKVYWMAKSKGDGGFLPFLESIGLKLSSALLIARYLAGEKLYEVIEKVKFLKEILFTSSSSEDRFGQKARNMMMHLSIPIDEEIQSTLSFFEKMEARYGGINMLGQNEASFPYLIESFPKILLLSPELHFKPLIHYLQLLRISKEGISSVLMSFPPIMFYDIEKDLKPKLLELQKAGVTNRDHGKMLLKYPWILSTSIQENYDQILAYFNEKKIPKSSIDFAIISWPPILGCSTMKMNLIVEEIHKLNIHRKKLSPIITSSPQLLLRRPSELLQVVSLFEELGFDSKAIGRILCRCPEIFASTVNTLRKKIDFLINFGFSRHHLSRVIKKYPELLLLDTDSTLLPRMSFLMGFGLSRKDVCSMIYRFSPILGYSIKVVLKPKLEFLLSTMQKPVRDIVAYPRYFSYSLEKKIKPRFVVLRNRKVDCSLKDMLGKNDYEFAEEYMGMRRLLVASYPAETEDRESTEK